MNTVAGLSGDSVDLGYLNNVSSGKTNDPKTAKELQERFLTLLVAQLKNQDPMNPMDNAQTTTQLAQINTVAGIEKLNTALTDMAMQSQSLTGSSLLGKSVAVDGDLLNLQSGSAKAAVNLETGADKVSVQVVNSLGQEVDRFNLGAKAAGPVAFEWQPATGMKSGVYQFKVNATQQGQEVSAQSLSVWQVQSIVMGGAGLKLGLANGQQVAFSDVKTLAN